MKASNSDKNKDKPLGGKEYSAKHDIKPLDLPDGVDAPVDGSSGDNKDSILFDKKISENGTKSGKKAEESVNTNIQPMKKKNTNIFDQLYSTVMEEGFDFEDDFPPADGGEEEEGGFGLDDEGGEEVTITLTSDQVDTLRDILSQLGDDEEDSGDLDIEDLADEEGDDEDPFGEAVDSQQLSDSKGKALTGTGNKVGKVKGKGGKVDKGDPKNEPEPKDLGDAGGKGLTGKDNKVKSTVTPGDFMK